MGVGALGVEVPVWVLRWGVVCVCGVVQCGAAEAAKGRWELHVQQHLHAYLALAGRRLACGVS